MMLWINNLSVYIERYTLIFGIARFREGRGTDDGSRIFWFEGKVDKSEIRVIVFGSNMLKIFSVGKMETLVGKTNLPRSSQYWWKRRKPSRTPQESHGNQEGALGCDFRVLQLWFFLLLVSFVRSITLKYRLRTQKNERPEERYRINIPNCD